MAKHEYLKRREERMRMERDGRRGRRDYEAYDEYRYDGRNPYGSEGGYVSNRRGRDRNGTDYERINPYGDREFSSRDGNYSSPRNSNRDYDMDYEQYNEFDGDSKSYEEIYKRDLKKWIERLKENDRFKIPKEQLITRAKSMSINFDNYTEEEFYATYLLLQSLLKGAANDYNMYIKFAKQFLDSEEEEIYGSDKLCVYLYEIVKGGK